MEFITFETPVPDDLPITQAVVGWVQAAAAGGEHGILALQKGVTGLLSGLMALEQELNTIRQAIAGE